MASRHKRDKDSAKDSSKDKILSNCSSDSVKVVAESIGIASLPDDAASYISDHVTFMLKSIVQGAAKHMHHAKRRKLSTVDMDYALIAKNMEPLNGMTAKEHIPFRFTSGGGRELHFTEDKETDLNELINSILPKVPVDLSLRSHWLSIQGVQPAIPENPPPANKELQKKEILDTDIKTMIDRGHKQPKRGLKRKHPSTEMVKLKELTPHELSKEQQLFFKEVTEACVGPDENKRSEALSSLANDPGLHQLLPRIINFLSMGVGVNIVQNNLALLIYLMRMVKSLLDNNSLYIEKYLHELLPSILTCVVCNQVCLRPDSDNHWALRDFAARLVATICKNFSTTHNNIQARTTKEFTQALGDEKKSLATIYGVVAGLGELGPEVVRSCIFPYLKNIGERMRIASEGQIVNAADRAACDHLKKQLHKHIGSLLKQWVAAETLEEYSNKCGYYLGPILYHMAQKDHQAVSILPAQSSSATLVRRSSQPTQIILQSGSSAPTPLIPSGSLFPAGSVSQAPRTPATPTGNNKFVIMTSQRGPATGTELSATPGSSMTSSGQKIVVIQGANIKTEPVLQPGTPTVGGSIISANTITSAPPSTFHELGMKSIFPGQATNLSFTVKKEEKP